MNYAFKIALYTGFLFLVSCGQNYKFDLPPSRDEHGAAATYNNKVDLIFIIDDSESMKYHHSTLANSIPGMIQRLLASKLDMHIAVITTSTGGAQFSENNTGGRFLGTPKFLKSSDPDLANSLAQRLQPTQVGRDTELGMDSLFRVLSPSYLNGDGEGFLREEAWLAVIELTTEDDNTAGSSADWANKLDSLKPRFPSGDRSWVFNLIGTLDTSASCQTNPEWNYTERADKLIELANMSQGQMESVCSSNLASAVSNIRSRLVQIISEFKLSRVPDLATLKVYMNGVEVPKSSVNGWNYIPEKNSVRFYGTWLPSADANIRIDFTPATPD